jgi:hypothetical protein
MKMSKAKASELMRRRNQAFGTPAIRDVADRMPMKRKADPR